MVVFVGMVVSGCGLYLEGLGDKDLETCDCPTLQATVASIDWTGDGREPSSALTEVGLVELGDFPLRVETFYETPGREAAEELFNRMVDTAVSSGLQPATLGRQSAKYRTEHWDMDIYWSPTGDTLGQVSIDLFVDEPDSEAPEYLAPLIDAFGTR